MHEQLQLVQELAKCIRAKMPLEQALRSISDQSGKNLRLAADALSTRLAQGRSLEESISPSTSRDGQMLAASIAVGSKAGRLDEALESWASYHLAMHHCLRQRLTALIYPTFLIVVMVSSLVFTAYQLGPKYRTAFIELTRTEPGWLQPLLLVHNYPSIFLTFLLTAALAIPLSYFARLVMRDRHGMPRDNAHRSFLHAHVARLADMSISSGHSVEVIVPWLLRAVGFRSTSIASFGNDVSSLKTNQALQRGIGLESCLTLAALRDELIPASEATKLFQTIAEQKEQLARNTADRISKSLPIVVGAGVGIIVAVLYLALIYLPWLSLFNQLTETAGLNNQ